MQRWAVVTKMIQADPTRTIHASVEPCSAVGRATVKGRARNVQPSLDVHRSERSGTRCHGSRGLTDDGGAVLPRPAAPQKRLARKPEAPACPNTPCHQWEPAPTALPLRPDIVLRSGDTSLSGSGSTIVHSSRRVSGKSYFDTQIERHLNLPRARNEIRQS